MTEERLQPLWVAPLLSWYDRSARPLPWRQSADPYRVLVSEVMLQQTRVAAVIPYYARFIAELPDIPALAAVSEDRLNKLWEGLGYYSRAKNLKRAAQACMDKHNGRLPDGYEALLALPGLGPYTAGAVASIAFGRATPAVDGNVLRVLSRLDNDDADVSQARVKARARETLLAIIPLDRPGDFNQALMELGATVCVPNGRPDCANCPLSAHCRARALGREGLLPVKSGKKPRRITEKTVFALSLPGGLMGKKRPETGLLSGLYQLPERAGRLTADEAMEQLSLWELRPLGALYSYERKHVFTHVEWHMLVYAASVSGEVPPGWRLLTEENALPAAYRVCL